MKRTVWLVATIGLALTACEPSGNSLNLPEDGVEDCKYQTWDDLNGSTWVYNMLATDGSGTREEDIKTRVMFFKEGEQLKAKYTVGSYSDVYTYTCNERAGELACFEEPKVKDWCQALMVVDKECTFEKLSGWDSNLTQAEFDEGFKAAQENIEKYKAGDQWEQFVFNNNNLGNKLQGRLYAKIKTEKCYLQVTDNYMTIFDGEKKEDSNPVGTDQFVLSEQELMFEHCTDSSDLVPMKVEAFPETAEAVQPCIPNRNCGFAGEETAYFHYIGIDGRETKEGCTYSYDVWADWVPKDKGQAAEIVEFNGKNEARYGFSMSFPASETGEPEAHVVEMVRYAECDGKKEQVEVACTLLLVQ